METEYQSQTEWILEHFPDSVRYPDKLGLEAGPSSVSFPEPIRGLYFKSNIDPQLPGSYYLINVVDSFVSGNTVFPVVGESDLDGIVIDSQLLACLYRNQILYLARRIGNATPRDTFSIPGDEGTILRDLANFWLVQFPIALNVDTVMTSLQSALTTEAVTYIPVMWPLDDHPSEPDELHCQWTNDLSDQQYHLFSPDSIPGGVDAYGAWNLLCERWATTNADVLIGICDNGYGTNTNFHPDLLGNVSPLSNVRFPESVQEVHGNHGTAVAGVCGATAFDIKISEVGKIGDGYYTGGGGIGVSPRAKMILTDSYDSFDGSDDLLDDLKYLVDTCRVDVLNMSWGYLIRDPAVEAILERAFYQRGIVLIAGAGNCSVIFGCGKTFYPAALPYVLAVTATDSSGARAGENYGAFVDIAAPGVDILTTGGQSKLFDRQILDYGYSRWNGTSMSAAIGTATAALIKTAYPEIGAATIYDILTRSCDPVPGFTTYPNNYVGYGKVNARKAVERVINGLHCDGIAGDVNTDCYVNWADCLLLRKYMIGDTTLPQPNNADVDGDCMIDISDFAALVSFVLNGGPVPVSGCVEGLANSVEEKEAALPLLKNAYPNPCNPSASISYDLPKACPVKVTIFNLLGEVVNVLQDGRQEAGAYTVSWNGQNLKGETVSSGIYLYQLRAGEYTATRKLALLK